MVAEAWSARTPVLVNAGCAATVEHCRRSGGGLRFDGYGEFEVAVDRLVGRRRLRGALGRTGRAPTWTPGSGGRWSSTATRRSWSRWWPGRRTADGAGRDTGPAGPGRRRRISRRGRRPSGTGPRWPDGDPHPEDRGTRGDPPHQVVADVRGRRDPGHHARPASSARPGRLGCGDQVDRPAGATGTVGPGRVEQRAALLVVDGGTGYDQGDPVGRAATTRRCGRRRPRRRPSRSRSRRDGRRPVGRAGPGRRRWHRPNGWPPGCRRTGPGSGPGSSHRPCWPVVRRHRQHAGRGEEPVGADHGDGAHRQRGHHAPHHDADRPAGAAPVPGGRPGAGRRAPGAGRSRRRAGRPGGSRPWRTATRATTAIGGTVAATRMTVRDWYQGRVQSARRRRRRCRDPLGPAGAIAPWPSGRPNARGRCGMRRSAVQGPDRPPQRRRTRARTPSPTAAEEGQGDQGQQRHGGVGGEGPEVDRPADGVVEDRGGPEGARGSRPGWPGPTSEPAGLGQGHRHEPGGHGRRLRRPPRPRASRTRRTEPATATRASSREHQQRPTAGSPAARPRATRAPAPCQECGRARQARMISSGRDSQVERVGGHGRPAEPGEGRGGDQHAGGQTDPAAAEVPAGHHHQAGGQRPRPGPTRAPGTATVPSPVPWTRRPASTYSQ